MPMHLPRVRASAPKACAAALLGLLVLSCTNLSHNLSPEAGAGGVSGAGGSGGMPPTACIREPAEHRPSETVCDQTRPSSAGTPGMFGDCMSDDDCTAGTNGRCQAFRGGAMCTYDECFEDSECNNGGPCACESAFWSDANSCLGGDCQTDSDCGEAGFCSPTFGTCGNYSGVIAYYCHTCDDECIDDSDCVGDMGMGYCMYSPEVARWVCGYGQCVG